jgi:hypothetical protein
MGTQILAGAESIDFSQFLMNLIEFSMTLTNFSLIFIAFWKFRLAWTRWLLMKFTKFHRFFLKLPVRAPTIRRGKEACVARGPSPRDMTFSGCNQLVINVTWDSWPTGVTARARWTSAWTTKGVTIILYLEDRTADDNMWKNVYPYVIRDLYSIITFFICVQILHHVIKYNIGALPLPWGFLATSSHMMCCSGADERASLIL